MLTVADSNILQAAYGLLQAGDAGSAQARLATLPDAKQQHPDALHLRALIAIRTGAYDQARRALEAALQVAPAAFGIWLTYGNFLGDIGEFDEAARAFDQASALNAGAVEPWLNLGLTAIDAGRLNQAADALDRATSLAPDRADAWNARGMVELKRANPDSAVSLFVKALTHAPNDTRSRHNLAVALRALDQPETALEQIDYCITAAPNICESLTIRAHILAELGRFDEALAQYRAVTTTAPDYLDAHETLARLLPQLGQNGAALDSYRTALQQMPQSEVLWYSALAAAVDVKDNEQLLAWAHDAETRFGGRVDFTLAEATALGRSGDPKAALALLQGLLATAPDSASLHAHLCHTLLMLGDPKAAEAHALRATELAPLDQFGWAYLTIIWRLLNDPREAWLADYDRLVMTVDLDPEDAVEADAWFTPLRASVEQLHTTMAHPAEQSLRGGTQTRGNIFEKRNPDMRGFADHVRQAVESMLPRLPLDETHPFLRRNIGQIKFAGSWSVKLASSGFHTNHIHQSGWLSSAFYLSLPPEVGASQAGALTFGVPDAAFGLDLEPRRVEIPRAGRLVLFPSYFWHGTVPFESQFPRVTMAFDAVPA
jgi:Tfp pilus assembly protein PilF